MGKYDNPIWQHKEIEHSAKIVKAETLFLNLGKVHELLESISLP